MSERFLRYERVANIASLKCEEDNRGYLIFRDVPIARSGVYQYYGQEIGRNSEPNKIFRVFRDESTYKGSDVEQSLENIPITDDHPSVDVSSDNYQILEKGHTEGKPYHKDGMVIVPKVVVKDKDLQQKIKSGKREVSIGFLGHYKWGDKPKNCNEYVDGTEHVYKINHLAVVDKGKAGPQFRFNKDIVNDKKVVKEMDEAQLKNAFSEFMGPIQNKLEQLNDTLSLANARLDHLENSEKEEEKKDESAENGVVNPSMNEEHGKIEPLATGEGSGEEGEKKLVEMVYPETRKIVTQNAQVLSLINGAHSLIDTINKEMDEDHKDEEKEEMHKNALKGLNEAAEKMKEAKDSMATIPSTHNAVVEDFSNACEAVINASEKLEDIAVSNSVSRGASRVARQVIRLERSSNAEAAVAEKKEASEKREELTRGVNSESSDPLVEMNRPQTQKVSNSMHEVNLDFSLGDSTPFDVPSGFMANERASIKNSATGLQLAEVGSAILSKVANSGMGLIVRSFDVSQSNEGESFLK